MTIRRMGLFSDSSTDHSHGSASSYINKSSLLSIPTPRSRPTRRSKSSERLKPFLCLQTRYIEDQNEEKENGKIKISDVSQKKKPRRVKRANAFYLNKAQNEEQPRSFSFSDGSRGSVSTSVGEADTEGSNESLDVLKNRRRAKNAALLLDRKDVLLNLRKKMKKKIPKYQGTFDVLQKKILATIENVEFVNLNTKTLLLSKASHHSFEHKRKRYLGCTECAEPVFEGDLVICSNESPPKHVWHPKCFQCYTCGKELVDLQYHPSEGRKYCEKHKPVLTKICSYCMEDIKTATYTKANGRYYHEDHFQCWRCAHVLSGDKYYGCGVYPMCIQCYDVYLAKPCRTCKGAIQIDTPFYSLRRKRWHATPACFKCNSCSQSLVGKKLVSCKGELYCNKQCHSNMLHSRTSNYGSNTSVNFPL